MKKISLIAIFCLISNIGIFAQSGYRNFTFGMNVEQVQRLAPDIVPAKLYGGGDDRFILMYLYNAELGSTLDYENLPWVPWPGEYTLYYSEKEDVYFNFFDNKLGLVVLFFKGNIIDDLRKRYGNKSVLSVKDKDGKNVTDTVTWIEGKRIILYYSNDDRSVLVYYDAEVFYPLIQKAMQDFRNSKRSRID
jgi:hypothetical protein